MSDEQKTIIIDYEIYKFPSIKEIIESINNNFFIVRKQMLIKKDAKDNEDGITKTGFFIKNAYVQNEFWIMNYYTWELFCLESNETVFQTLIPGSNLELVWLAGQKEYENKFICFREPDKFCRNDGIYGFMNLK